MIFDKFASYVERHSTDLLNLTSDTHLFHFPFTASEVLPKRHDTYSDEMLAKFQLPFPSVAVEDNQGCVFLFDTKDDQIGMDSTRKFITVVSANDFYGDPLVEKLTAQYPDGINLAAFGTLFSIKKEQVEGRTADCESSQWLVTSWLSHVVGFTKTDVVFTYAGDELSNILSDLGDTSSSPVNDAVTAIEELLCLTKDPDTFVFEQSPTKPRKTKPGRIARSQDRPKYILLKPDDIRRVMKVDQTAGSAPGTKKRAHERRAHVRVLRSERFTKKRGAIIPVPAVWVGPTERVIGNQRYRVILDSGKRVASQHFST